MNCPKCGSFHDKVLESRSNKEGTSIRRRRMCCDCGYRFTSYEHIERKPIVVVKKDGRHQTFDIGAASYLDLRDSELALTRSRLAYFQAVYNYLIAGAELELLLGNAVDALTVPVPDRSKFK